MIPETLSVTDRNFSHLDHFLPFTFFDVIDYGVTKDLQKKSFTEPAKSCPLIDRKLHWKKLGCLVYRTAILKTFF